MAGQVIYRTSSFQDGAGRRERKRADLLEQLLEFCLAHLLPEAEGAGPDRAAGLLRAVGRRSAELAAQWMTAGFVHGVLNTDNLVVTGESFDYGPWRFLPHFDPGFTAAYFDQTGLYAYARQPESVFWALQQLAGALTFVGERDALVEALGAFPEQYRAAVREAFHRRLGLEGLDPEQDARFVSDFLDWMKASQAPWEAVFFDWFCGSASTARAMNSERASLYARKDFHPVRAAIEARTPRREARLEHPYFASERPEHLVIERVEAIWEAIAREDDWTALDAALSRIAEARAAYDLGAGRPGFLAEAGA